MKSNRIAGSIVLAILSIALAQMSCDTTEFFDDRSDRIKDRDACEEKGGIWHDFPNQYCEMPETKKTATSPGQGMTATDPPVPGSGEGCKAYEHITIEALITEQAQYDTWNSCQYSLRVTNNLPDQDIWLWIHHIPAVRKRSARAPVNGLGWVCSSALIRNSLPSCVAPSPPRCCGRPSGSRRVRSPTP